MEQPERRSRQDAQGAVNPDRSRSTPFSSQRNTQRRTGNRNRDRNRQDWREYSRDNVVNIGNAREIQRPYRQRDSGRQSRRDNQQYAQRDYTARDKQKRSRRKSKHSQEDPDARLYLRKPSRGNTNKKRTKETSIQSSAILYTDDESEPLPSLLARYNDVPEYREGAFHPKDFDYHEKESCGPKGDRSLEEAFRDNGIHCDFADYAIYSRDNRAKRQDLERLTRARKKACRCEVERRLTNEHLRSIGQSVDGDHIWPLNKAALYCKQCAQMERELYKHGYLKHRTEIEKHDAVTGLLTLVHELLEGPEEAYASSEGNTKLDKIARFIWDNVLPLDLVLKNIKRQMPFIDFKVAVSTVQDFLTEKRLTRTIRKLHKQKSGKKRRLESARRRRSLYHNKADLLKGLKAVAERRIRS